MSSSDTSVGAYALTTVMKRPLISGRRRVMSLSLTPIGDSVIWDRRRVRMAKPTPCMRQASWGRPFQKNVYSPPTSDREPSSASRVSDSAAMSTSYLQSSVAISAVRRAGRSVSSLSKRVRTFQVANRSGLRVDVHDFRPQERDAQRVRLPVREVRNGQCLGHLF